MKRQEKSMRTVVRTSAYWISDFCIFDFFLDCSGERFFLASESL